MALGERLHKDVYEALRAGPAWDKTLFMIVYDDGGDFYDHGAATVVLPFHCHCPSLCLFLCPLRLQFNWSNRGSWTVVACAVVPPFEGVPADGAGCHVAGSKCEEHFDFRRLGPRGSALAISPLCVKMRHPRVGWGNRLQ